ncbi:DsrE family protein [Candidatus Latescibacterota bacterium]
MKRLTIIHITVTVLLVAVLFDFSHSAGNTQKANAAENNNPSKLMVLWTSGDRDVALKMVYMYTYNAKKNNWWDEVRFVIWGPSSLLLSEDKELQDYIKKMKEEGVTLEACKACADMYGVSDKLAELGIDVKYMGKPVTDMLKSGWISMTF